MLWKCSVALGFVAIIFHVLGAFWAWFKREEDQQNRIKGRTKWHTK